MNILRNAVSFNSWLQLINNLLWLLNLNRSSLFLSLNGYIINVNITRLSTLSSFCLLALCSLLSLLLSPFYIFQKLFLRNLYFLQSIRFHLVINFNNLNIRVHLVLVEYFTLILFQPFFWVLILRMQSTNSSIKLMLSWFQLIIVNATIFLLHYNGFQLLFFRTDTYWLSCPWARKSSLRTRVSGCRPRSGRGSARPAL